MPQLEMPRHDVTINAMDAIGFPVVECIESRRFASVSIDVTKCNACGMCAMFCPTGALKRDETDDVSSDIKQLEFTACELIYHPLCVLFRFLGGGAGAIEIHARIKACVDLYNARKIDRIIVSGDNHHVSYNEPEAMRASLVEMGIPNEVIFLDYAGFRTFDSVVRAREVFGQQSFTVVSQKFHNERAIFIAGKKGIDAVGYNASGVGLNYGLMTYVRELFARCKVYLDLATGKKPHFLGEPVDLD